MASQTQQVAAQPPSPPPPYPFFLGGVAASFAACFTHPLDMVKTRMQNSSAQQGMLGVLTKTAKEEGVRGLYVGLTASLARQMSYSLVRFGAYDALKEAALAQQRNTASASAGKTLPAWKMAACASLAGAAGGLAGNWADVLLVRMTSDVLKPKDQRFGYSNAISGLVRMTREEGVSALFRGIVPNLTRAVLMNASQLATYDLFKGALLQSGWYTEGTWLHFSASFLAGTVATTICSPADVIKARIMAAGNGNGNGNGNGSGNSGSSPNHSTSSSSSKHASSPVEKLRASFRAEGVRFLFRGWTPAWVRLSPNTILIFITLEKLRVFVDWSREQQGLQSRRQYEAAKKEGEGSTTSIPASEPEVKRES